jgi:hypothetical protein
MPGGEEVCVWVSVAMMKRTVQFETGYNGGGGGEERKDGGMINANVVEL